jgi:GMP synthase (glutamine-hydrolysing)
MILIINICKERLHYFEFVSPITDILDKSALNYFVRDYKKLNRSDLKKCNRVIICGTSLFDNEFADNFEKFEWIKKFEKPVLGICGGMHIIGLVFGGRLKRGSEIGFYTESFGMEFLGLKGKTEVYHLHNNYIDFSRLMDFKIFSGRKIAQAVQHKKKSIYGVLFHPEVRQKDLIKNFCLL